MKKFMLFMIALIPLTLLFTVQLTSNVVSTITYIAVEKVAFEKNYYEIKKSDDNPVELSFPARVSPTTATNKDVIYSSSNENIAIVDSEGIITIRDFGEVVITVKSATTDSIQDKCTFLVTDDKPHRINFTNVESEFQLIKGQVIYLKNEIIPKEALDKNVVYSSSDENVLKVAQDGRLTAIDGGVATITVTTINGKKDTIEVLVFVPTDSIVMEDINTNITTAKNTAKFPEVSVLPVNATNKKILYTTSNANIGTIDNDGNISLKEKGVVKFTATTENGGHSVEYTINYTGGYVINATIDTDYLNKTITTDYEKDKIINITYTAQPLDYNQSYFNNLWWESSNENVIKIVDNKIIVVGGGVADVYLVAKTDIDSTIKSKTTIKVNRSAGSIAIVDNGNSELGDTPNDGAIITTSLSTEIKYEVLTKDLTNDHTDIVNIETSIGKIIKGTNNNFYIEFNQVKAQSATIIITAGSVSKNIVVTFVLGNVNNIAVKNGDNIKVEYGNTYSFLINGVSYVWSGYDDKIIDNGDNTFTAVKGGITSISTTDKDDNQHTILVEVIRPVQDIFIDGEEVNQNSITTSLKTWKFNASVSPVDATEKVVGFTSSDMTVATVNNDGLVTFIKAGTTQIIMQVKKHPNKDEVVSKTITITSTFGLPTSFVFENSNNITISDIGQTARVCIGDLFTPNDYVLNISDVIFLSGNSSIASVEKVVEENKVYGVITGVDGGTTTISAQIGSAQQTINVTVNVLSKSLNIQYFNNGKYNDFPTLAENKWAYCDGDLQLSTVVYPLNTTNPKVKYEAIDGVSVNITEDGYVTFNQRGLVRIRATVLDTGISTSVVFGWEIPQPYVYQGTTDVSHKEISVERLSANPQYRVKLMLGSYAGYLLEEWDYSDLNYVCDNNKVTITHDNEGLFTIVRPDEFNESMYVLLTFRYESNGTAVGTYLLAIDDVDIIQVINGRTTTLDNDTDKNYGYEQKRVFGDSSYDNYNGKYEELLHTSSIPVFYQAYPTTNTDVLHWSVGVGSEYAYFQEGRLHFYRDNMPNLENLVEVRVHNRTDWDKSEIRKTYNMIVIKKSINVYDQETFKFATNTNWNVVLHANLGVASEDDDGIKPFSNLADTGRHYYTAPIHGNGFTINFNNFTTNVDVMFSGAVRNVVLKRQSDSVGQANFTYNFAISGVDVKYSYTKFSNAGVVFVNQTLNTTEFYKCYFTNTTKCGIQMGRASDSNGSQTVIFEDCIFYNTGQCAVSYEEGYVRIKGKFDVYNFKAAADFNNALYEAALKSAYKSNDFKPYVDKTGTSVANIGIASFKGLYGARDDVKYYNPSTDTYESTDNITGRNYQFVKGYTGTLIKTHMINLWMQPLYNSDGSAVAGAITKNTQIDFSMLYRLGA